MATSPVLGLPLPSSGGTDQVPADLLTLMTAAELFFVGRFANAAARDTKIPSGSRVGGMVAWLTSPGKFTYYDAILAAWADLMNPNAWDTWTPTMHNSSSSAVAVGSGGSQIGRYRLTGKTCSFQATWTFAGPDVNGRTGQLVFDLPPSAAGANIGGLGQTGPCSLFVPATSENYLGFWTIPAGGTTAQPHFPKDRATAAMSFFQNSDTTGGSGTGVPNIPGAWPLANGGQMTASGSYQTA